MSALQSERTGRHNPFLRAIGGVLLLGSLGMLLLDAYVLLQGVGSARFSSFGDVLVLVHPEGLERMRAHMIDVFSATIWYSGILPILNVPVSLGLGLPGIWLMRHYAPAIRSRAPSAFEIEMVRSGLSPRHVRRARR